MAQMMDRILDFENMAAAWKETRKGGKSAGVDHWSVRRFGWHWEEHVRDLIDEVRGNRYKPRKLRIIYVPKRHGGRRRLAIPTVRDRVLQRAVLQVLMPRLDRMFFSCSYGYRPKRSLFHAVAAILKYRERGLTWVLDADIDDFFSSVDLGRMRTLIAQHVGDPQVVKLLYMWLEVGRVDRKRDKGLAQGMPISPLLSNLYLHELDRRLVRWRWSPVRYADDFIVLTRDEASARHCYGVVEGVLHDLKLRFEPSKTRITSFDEGFEFLGVYFDRESYVYTWEEKRVRVKGSRGPLWSMWDYFPHGYE